MCSSVHKMKEEFLFLNSTLKKSCGTELSDRLAAATVNSNYTQVFQGRLLQHEPGGVKCWRVKTKRLWRKLTKFCVVSIFKKSKRESEDLKQKAKLLPTACGARICVKPAEKVMRTTGYVTQARYWRKTLLSRPPYIHFCAVNTHSRRRCVSYNLKGMNVTDVRTRTTLRFSSIYPHKWIRDFCGWPIGRS